MNQNERVGPRIDAYRGAVRFKQTQLTEQDADQMCDPFGVCVCAG